MDINKLVLVISGADEHHGVFVSAQITYCFWLDTQYTSVLCIQITKCELLVSS